jgi:hypothetical protein
MGIAAYNRGSKVIREAIDRELREQQVITRPVANRHHCERCGGKLGVRLDRGCTWSNRLVAWVNACRECKLDILRENGVRV